MVSALLSHLSHPNVSLLTCSSGQVLHHSREVVTVGVAVAEKEDVLVRPGQSVLTLSREGQACGLNLTCRTISTGRISRVSWTGGAAVTPPIAIRSCSVNTRSLDSRLEEICFLTSNKVFKRVDLSGAPGSIIVQ